MPNPSQDQTLEQLLADYRQSGVDSEGHFTLNPARAREMLEQFQLPEPAYYALHLASFLIGAGASRVSVERQAGGLLFLAPGASIEPAFLVSPFAALLKTGVEPYLSELALGLNAVLGQKATVELAANGKTAHYRPDQIEVVDGSPSTELRLLVVGAGEGAREMELLAEHFVLSPIPVQVSGKRAASPRPWSPAALQLSLINSAYPLPEMPASPIDEARPTSARFSAVMRVGREVSGVSVLHLGRLYTIALPWTSVLTGWYVEVVLCTDRLQKDLSQQALRENQTFHNIFSTLQQQLEAALQTLPLSVWRDTEAQALWDAMIASLAAQPGRAGDALQRQWALVQNLRTAPDGLAKANAIYRLGLLRNLTQTRAGAPEVLQAENILNQLNDPWEFQRVPTLARMALSSTTPGLERSVRALADDPRASAEDRLEAYRWLSQRADPQASWRSVYRCRLAQQLYELGRPELALAELENATGAENLTPLLQAELWETRARVLSDLGHFEKALECLGRLLALQREEHGQYSLRLGLTLTRLAVLLEHLGKTRQAAEYRQWSQRLHD